ncbi:MAG: biotin--[Eubacterium sp.]|nr:biotin--[acetyl-CoA-carboxylase] ligase [Eubacterium sp.]
MDKQLLQNLIRFPATVFTYPTVDSTNNEAKRLLAQGMSGVLLLAADEQTAGRGRQGKRFYSPADTGVYFSLVLPYQPADSEVSVTTAVAVAVCRAIEQLTPLKPKIKWVNDIYLNGKKVAGILAEAVRSSRSANADAVVIGIGINISTADFPSTVENGGALDVAVGREQLVAAVSNALSELLSRRFADFAEEYRARSLLLGEEIVYVHSGEQRTALAVDIDASGGLTVLHGDGSFAVLRSGEISVRKAASQK